MIALMHDECVDKKNWISHDELVDMTAIAESTPGPISLNCATFIGYRQAGFAGASLATAGLVIPSFVTLYLISLFFDNILEIAIIANAFKGIKIAVGVIIFNIGLKMVQKMPKKMLSIIITTCFFTLSLINHMLKWQFSTIYMIIISGFIGYITFMINNIKVRRGANNK